MKLNMNSIISREFLINLENPRLTFIKQNHSTFKDVQLFFYHFSYRDEKKILIQLYLTLSVKQRQSTMDFFLRSSPQRLTEEVRLAASKIVHIIKTKFILSVYGLEIDNKSAPWKTRLSAVIIQDFDAYYAHQIRGNVLGLEEVIENGYQKARLELYKGRKKEKWDKKAIIYGKDGLYLAQLLKKLNLGCYSIVKPHEYIVFLFFTKDKKMDYGIYRSFRKHLNSLGFSVR